MAAGITNGVKSMRPNCLNSPPIIGPLYRQRLIDANSHSGTTAQTSNKTPMETYRATRCKICNMLRESNSMLNSVCAECRFQRDLREKHRAERARQVERTEKAQAWKPGRPQLIDDGADFVCAACRGAKSATKDVLLILRAGKTPLFDGDTRCDACYKEGC